MDFFRQTLVIARKDLRAELRTKEAINAALAFSIVTRSKGTNALPVPVTCSARID